MRRVRLPRPRSAITRRRSRPWFTSSPTRNPLRAATPRPAEARRAATPVQRAAGVRDRCRGAAGTAAGRHPGARDAPRGPPPRRTRLPEPRYTPSRDLADFVRCRDLTCRFPGCDKPAQFCDIDHTVPYPVGPTHPSNLKCLCRFHHLLKTFWNGVKGWRDRQLPDGTVVWTSPHRAHLHHPPGQPAPVPAHCANPPPPCGPANHRSADNHRRPRRDDAQTPTHPRPQHRQSHRRRTPTQRRLATSPNATNPHRSDSRSPLRRGDGEEMPLAGHALELVSAAVLELEP